MSIWKHTLDLKDIWNKVDEGEMTVQELTKEVVIRLKNLKIQNDITLDSIIEEFEGLAEVENADVNDFDYILDNLYDWGDTLTENNNKFTRFSQLEKNCWIKTQF